MVLGEKEGLVWGRVTKEEGWFLKVVTLHPCRRHSALTKYLERRESRMGTRISPPEMESIPDDSRMTPSPSISTAEMHCVWIVLRVRIRRPEQARPLKEGEKETQVWVDRHVPIPALRRARWSRLNPGPCVPLKRLPSAVAHRGPASHSSLPRGPWEGRALDPSHALRTGRCGSRALPTG